VRAVRVGGNNDWYWLVWDIATGKKLNRSWSTGPAGHTLSMSADRKVIASGIDSGKVAIWEAANPNQPKAVLEVTPPAVGEAASASF